MENIRGMNTTKADELHVYMDLTSIEHDIKRGYTDSGPAETCDNTWNEIENPRINTKTGKTRIMTVIPGYLQINRSK